MRDRPPVEETVEVAAGFLAAAGDRFAVLDAAALAGAGATAECELGVQLTPDLDDTDGMYIACFRRLA